MKPTEQARDTAREPHVPRERERPDLLLDPVAAPTRGPARAFAGWLMLGLALRLLLLPAALHPDLFSVYDRVRLWMQGDFALADFSFQALPTLVHGVFAKLLALQPVNFEGVYWPDPAETQIFDETTRLLGLPGAVWHLALLKLPYLLGDVAVGFLLTRLVPARRALAVFAVWMVHPIGLYVTGAFAKYEPFMLVPFLIGLIELQRGKQDRGFVWIGVAMAMRIYPLVVAPALVLATAGGRRRRLELSFLILAPLLAVLVASALRESWAWLAVPSALAFAWQLYARARGGPAEWLLLGGYAVGAVLLAPDVVAALTSESYSAENILHHVRFYFRNNAGTRTQDALLLFPMAWAVALYWAAGRPAARASDDANSVYRDAADAALLAALAFFSLAFFHPQYTLLLVVLVLARLHCMRDASKAHALQVAGLLFFLLTFRGGNTTVRLFLPLAPEPILSMPGPLEALPDALANLPWVGVGRTLFVMAAGWMTLDLLRQRRASEASSARPSWVPFALAALVWPAAIATFLVHLPGQPFPERVWGPWPIDGRWFPGAQMNSVVFHPPTGDGDYVVLRPGHRGGRVPAAATELRLERNVDDVFLEEARLDLTSEEAATMPDGGVRLSLQDFRFRPNDWYRLTAVRGELEVAPAALQVELWRSRNGAELLSEVVDLFRERYLGATRANDAPAAGADPREGVASKRGELRAGALGLGHAWLGSCAFLLVLGLGLVASTARRSARR